MESNGAASDRSRPALRVDQLDDGTVHRAASYVAARAKKLETGPGDAVAFNELYQVCRPLLAALAAGRCPGCWSIEDRIQDLWLRLLENLASHDSAQGSFHGWLMSVARNGLNRQDRGAHVVSQFDDDAEHWLPSREPDPVIPCEAGDERAILKAELESLRVTLTKTSFRIVEARLVGGREYADIAAELGLTAKQVRDRYSRSVVGLRTRLRRLR
jgi:RNA polymerase sigma factor (sigma-70 family)